MKNTNTNATKSTSTIRLSSAQKSEMYQSYLSVKDALVAVYTHAPDAAQSIDLACNSLAALIKSVHGVEVNAAALWSDVLVRLVSFKTKKANEEKGITARQWVKFNGLGGSNGFTSWLKNYSTANNHEVEWKAEDPNKEKKSKKAMPSKKEVAINVLKALPEEERMALIEQLLAA